MQHVALQEAGACLDELIGMIAVGNEVVITRNDGSAFKIIPIPNNNPYPKFGSAKGLIEMSNDFDEPIEGFEEYMP